MAKHGTLNSALVCPHCTMKGQVYTKSVKRKAGISGGKAVAALFTVGLTAITPGIGLSRKETITEAYCDKCSSAWSF